MNLMTILSGVCIFFIACSVLNQVALQCCVFVNRSNTQWDEVMRNTVYNLSTFTVACITLAGIINFMPY